MKKNKLLSSSLMYTFGNFFVQGLSFITLPLYTRIMDVEAYGNYNIYVSWVGIFVIFAGLQTQGSFSIAKAKYADEFEDYVATAISVSTIFFSIFFLVSLIFHKVLENIINFPEIILMFILFQAYFAYLQNSYSQYYIQQQESTKQLVLSLSVAIFNLLITIPLLLNFNFPFFSRILGGFIPVFVVGSYFIFSIYKKSKKKLNREYILFLLSTSVPLIFHNLGQQLLAQLDRLMIGNMLDKKSVAIYSFGYSIGTILQIVVGGLVMAWVPWLFEQKRQKTFDAIDYNFQRYLVIVIYLTIGYLSIFPEMVSLLGTGEYLVNKKFIILIIIGHFVAFLYTFPVNIQFYQGKTKFIPLGTFLAAVANWTLNLYLIKFYGIFGAAMATLISYSLLFIFHYAIAKVFFGETDLKIRTATLSVMIVLSYAMFAYIFLDTLIIRWGVCAIIGVCLIMYYKSDVKSLFTNKFKWKNR